MRSNLLILLVPSCLLFITVGCDREANTTVSQTKSSKANFPEVSEDVEKALVPKLGARQQQPEQEALFRASLKGNAALTQYVKDLLEADEQAALLVFSEMQAELDYDVLGEALFDHYLEKGDDMKSGLDAFKILSNNTLLATMQLPNFFEVYWKASPEKAIGWMRDNQSMAALDTAAGHIGEIAGSSDDPESRLNEILREDTPHAVRMGFTAEAIKAWASKDLYAAFEYMTEVEPHPSLDVAYYQMIEVAAEQDPKSSMVWANLISDYHLKKAAIASISSNWKTMDPEGYEQWQGQQDQAQ